MKTKEELLERLSELRTLVTALGNPASYNNVSKRAAYDMLESLRAANLEMEMTLAALIVLQQQ